MTNKKSLTGLIVLIGFLLLLTSCQKKDNDIEPKIDDAGPHLDSLALQAKIDLLDRQDYFPLQVRNYWQFSYVQNLLPFSLRVITGSENINNMNYHRLVVPQWTEYETKHYRKTPDGKVYELSYYFTGKEILKFNLTAAEGETWTYETTNFLYNEKDLWYARLISKQETVKLGNYTFKNCYKYYFDAPAWADEEHLLWLAPGIGLVKEVYSGGSSTILTRVKINDVEIDFR